MIGERSLAAFSQGKAQPVDQLLIKPIASAALADTRSFLRAASRGRHSETDAWFEADDTARFILDTSGRVLRTNAKARALADCGMVGSRGVFICAAHRSRAELDALLRGLADGSRESGRILFRAGDDEWCILDLMTTPEAPNRVFATARPVKPLDVARITALGAVFGLTRAETAVLLHLTAGATPKDIGRKLEMSIHTVRAHLRSICMRMGVKGINGALRLSFQMS